MGKQIYVNTNDITRGTLRKPGGQEHRWNAIAVGVFAELIHQAKGGGDLFSDEAVDRAALRLMNADERAQAEAQRKALKKQNKYEDGSIGYTYVKKHCLPQQRN